MTKPIFNKDLLLREVNPVVVSCSTLEQWSNLITYMEDELVYKNWESYKNEGHRLKYNVNVRLDMVESKNEEDSHYSVITYEDALLHTFTTNDNIDLTGINDTPTFTFITTKPITQFREDLLTNPNLAVNCRSENEAIELLTWADSKGKAWGSGKSYLEETYWNIYRDTIYYKLSEGVKGHIGYKDSETVILSYNQALVLQEDRVQGHTHDLTSSECKGYMESLKNEVAKQVGVPKGFFPSSFQDNTPTIVKSIHKPKLNFG